MSYYPFPTPAAPLTYSKSATKAASSGAATFLAFYVTNENTSTRYLWIKDSASTFATSDSSTTALYVFPIPGSSTLGIGHTFWGMAGTSFSSGISWGISTSATSYTDGSSTDHVLNIQKA